jgi:hypothetical protein
MQTQTFLSSPDQPTTGPGPVHLELTLKLHSYPKPDREPVKILVIGSKQSVSAIVVACISSASPKSLNGLTFYLLLTQIGHFSFSLAR